jgi:hypothetical protein
MTKYAQGTEVPADRSRAEIERVLTRYGAEEFMYGWDSRHATVGFIAGGRHVRFLLPMPAASEFTSTPTGRRRTASTARDAWEQSKRQRWRALGLVIKAKLEAVESGIVTFDQEFLAHIVMPNGRTVADEVVPRMVEALENGSTPALLALPQGKGNS